MRNILSLAVIFVRLLSQASMEVAIKSWSKICALLLNLSWSGLIILHLSFGTIHCSSLSYSVLQEAYIYKFLICALLVSGFLLGLANVRQQQESRRWEERDWRGTQFLPSFLPISILLSLDVIRSGYHLLQLQPLFGDLNLMAPLLSRFYWHHFLSYIFSLGVVMAACSCSSAELHHPT